MHQTIPDALTLMLVVGIKISSLPYRHRMKRPQPILMRTVSGTVHFENGGDFMMLELICVELLCKGALYGLYSSPLRM
ncbi:hypothetical protein GCM10008983_11880 [Lentibacillus halophilus]|uniref:Uncharacterized protein n=1 Tax=Lentibacillus halophilus TaxID=295065 RepID=A0ABN0Z7U1_9BACI